MNKRVAAELEELLPVGRNRIVQEVKTHMTRRKESIGAAVLGSYVYPNKP